MVYLKENFRYIASLFSLVRISVCRTYENIFKIKI